MRNEAERNKLRLKKQQMEEEKARLQARLASESAALNTPRAVFKTPTRPPASSPRYKAAMAGSGESGVTRSSPLANGSSAGTATTTTTTTTTTSAASTPALSTVAGSGGSSYATAPNSGGSSQANMSNSRFSVSSTGSASTPFSSGAIARVGVPAHSAPVLPRFDDGSSFVTINIDAFEEGDYSDDDDDREPAPSWADSANLRAALESQTTVNPDTIFDLNRTAINLQEVFGSMHHRRPREYTKRSSSASWTRDRLTLKEKREYNRKMGFQQ